jgi:hypothetical protein
MLVQITNTSSGNVSVPFGPTLPPGGSVIYSVSYNIDDIAWTCIDDDVVLDDIYGMTEEVRTLTQLWLDMVQLYNNHVININYSWEDGMVLKESKMSLKFKLPTIITLKGKSGENSIFTLKKTRTLKSKAVK